MEENGESSSEFFSDFSVTVLLRQNSSELGVTHRLFAHGRGSGWATLITVGTEMKKRYRVLCRGWGTYYCEDLVAKKQESLRI